MATRKPRAKKQPESPPAEEIKEQATSSEDTATPEEKQEFNEAAADVIQKPRTVVRAYCSRTGYNGWCDELVKPECHASQDKNGCKFGCPRVYLLSE